MLMVCIRSYLERKERRLYSIYLQKHELFCVFFILFHVSGIGISETDCGGIVNENINPSELLNCLLNSATDLVFESDIADDW